MTPAEIIREHMRKLGAKGGKRRAQTTTKAQRQAIGRAGGKASGVARKRAPSTA